jgi:hypothetical protein
MCVRRQYIVVDGVIDWGVYHSAGDQKGLAVPEFTTIREMFHEVAAERQGRMAFPKPRNVIQQTRRYT